MSTISQKLAPIRSGKPVSKGNGRQGQPKKKTGARAKKKSSGTVKNSPEPNKTAITRCVQGELRRYYEMLDGEEPSNVYQLVMRQAEHALIDSVMRECGGNQSKATKWLGISRGTLRNKLAEMGYD